MKHVIGVSTEINPVSASVTGGKTKRSMMVKIDKLLSVPDNMEMQGKYSSDKTIQFLRKLASQDKDKILLKDLCERKYYKRVFEAPLAVLNNEAWTTLREIFKGTKRENLQETVESALVKLLRTSIQSQSKIRESLATDKTLEAFEKIVAKKYAFIIDLPTRGWSAGGNDPLFVSDYKRRYFRSDAAGVSGFEIGALWSRHLGDMMRSIAFFRV